jgi:hypothetical protein
VTGDVDPAPALQPREPEEFQELFARIEAAVSEGRTDLRELGFWRLLGRVKSEPALAAHWADVAGRIDRAAFEDGVRFRVPVWLGNALLVLGTAVGAGAVAIALTTSSPGLAGVALVFAAGAWSTTLHDLAHWAIGRVVGIRFLCYFVGSWTPPTPGLKIDYATYLRASPGARVWMHASGAVATKLASFVVLAFWPASDAPLWTAWALLGLGVLQLVTDAVFSVRSSDWKRVRRELAVARRQAYR